jgi:hypothetical protein
VIGITPNAEEVRRPDVDRTAATLPALECASWREKVMKRGISLLTLVLGFVLATANVAGAGQYTLHPSGFGEHSYAAWKGGEGLPDSNGNKNQALYFQKMTSTATFAAGVALFKGFEGQQVSSIEGLSFWYGIDGHCGAGAPRFNLRFQPTGTTDPSMRQTIFIGCAAMTPGDTAVSPSGRVYEQRSITGPFTLLNGTIVSLAIVFDEGNDVGQGFVYLDDIEVDTTSGPHVWTSATDNGNGGTTSANTTLTASELRVALGEPLSTLLK